MLTSTAIIFLSSLTLGRIFKKLRIPSLVAMIIVGIFLGPYGFNLVDSTILNISGELRQLALIIILTRAGLSLDIRDLKKVGRPAFLMCFLPASFEILGVLILAPRLLGTSILDALIMGTVIAAVSPAVVIPRMIKIMEEGYGRENSIPQLVMAGASVDDIFVIVLFSSFTSLAIGGKVSISNFVQIPISIILGILLGAVFGFLLIKLFKKIDTRDTAKVLIILSFSFLLLELERFLGDRIPISGLIGIMSLGLVIAKGNNQLAERLSDKYSKLWIVGEILLFVLVGTSLDLSYAIQAGLSPVFLVFFSLIFRVAGVYLSLVKTRLSKKKNSSVC